MQDNRGAFDRPEFFARVDEDDDRRFYEQPRLVAHIDDAARAALAAYYARALPAEGDLLDLMSSWISHLPDDVRYRSVTGLGLNGAELAANPRLDRAVVHDLNRTPALPFADAAFDGCMIAVSVQYLTSPLAVFADIARVLRPGGVCAVSFSNRMFPTKAVAVWRALDDPGHARLVGSYLHEAGGFAAIGFEALTPTAPGGDPLYVVSALRTG